MLPFRQGMIKNNSLIMVASFSLPIRTIDITKLFSSHLLALQKPLVCQCQQFFTFVCKFFILMDHNVLLAVCQHETPKGRLLNP